MPANNIHVRDTILDSFLVDYSGQPLQLYTGPSPGPNNPATGTNIGEVTMGAPAFPPASGGTATANPVTSGVAAAAGTVGYARLAGGLSVTDFTVSVFGGGGDVQMPTLTYSIGDPLDCASFTWSQP